MRTSIKSAAFSIVRNACSGSYLRAVAKRSLERDFERAAAPFTQIHLHQINPASEEVRVLVGGEAFRDTPMIDMLALMALVRRVKPKRVFEFGTFTGAATLLFGLNTADDAHIWTLDMSPFDRVQFDGDPQDKAVDDSVIGRRFRHTPHAQKITQLLADSRQFNPTPYLSSMDFVFVDGCHDYEFVVNDSEKALQMLKPGGMLVWHDFSRAFPGVRRHLVKLAKAYDVHWVLGTQIAFLTT